VRGDDGRGRTKARASPATSNCHACLRTAPHRTTPDRTTPHRTAPHHTAPHHIAPHHTTPHHTTCTAPHHTAPHHIAPRHTPPAPHRTAPHRTTPTQSIAHMAGVQRTTKSFCVGSAVVHVPLARFTNATLPAAQAHTHGVTGGDNMTTMTQATTCTSTPPSQPVWHTPGACIDGV
jgi:hypothetical protein